MFKKTLIDIKPPETKISWPGNYGGFKKEIKKSRLIGRFKVFLGVAAIFIFVGGAAFLFSAYQFKQQAPQAIDALYQSLKALRDSLLALDETGAQGALDSAKKVLDEWRPPALLSGIGVVGSAFDDLNFLLSTLSNVSGITNDLKHNAFALITAGRGEELIGKLSELSKNIKKTEEVLDSLKSRGAALGYALGDGFLNVRVKLSQTESFLDSFIAWLDQPRPQNIVLLFQNPSEIRPAGGFPGSYGELALARASLSSLVVNDIYDPDGQLDIKVIPPKPLQFITTNWGARDGNWFFDFPTSAQKILDFLESSKIYSERSLKFSGLIALNTEVIKSLLGLIGPIELVQYGLVINQDNFLAEVQREVESGDDKKAGEPKKILKTLAPIVLGKIAQLSEADKRDLWEKLGGHLEGKDIMFYFRDPVLENYAKDFGLAGEVAVLPSKFSGDYLAVVNANIGGAKTDVFVSQKIIWESKIDSSGSANNILKVERTHNGHSQKDWWYRATNKNYIQTLVPAGAVLNFASGSAIKPVPVKNIYKNGNYLSDVEVGIVESSVSRLRGWDIEELFQFGKKTFAGWLDVPVGGKKKLTIQYVVPQAVKIADGGRYQFIFDKQSGVESNLDIVIESPPGYRWKENGKLIFRYSNKQLPARVILDLTLQEI